MLENIEETPEAHTPEEQNMLELKEYPEAHTLEASGTTDSAIGSQDRTEASETTDSATGSQDRTELR